jgi:hypothetical protein
MQHGPNFKKLIQIGRNDAQVPQSFKQRHFGAFGPIQNAGIEIQDAGISVQKGHYREDFRMIEVQTGCWL